MTNPLDVVQWVFTVLTGLGLLYLAFKKGPFERASLNGNASEAFMRTMQMSGAEMLKFKQEIETLKRANEVQSEQIRILKIKKYRILMDFTIGDPSTIGVVEIKPIVPSSEDVTKVIRKKRL